MGLEINEFLLAWGADVDDATRDWMGEDPFTKIRAISRWKKAGHLIIGTNKKPRYEIDAVHTLVTGLKIVLPAALWKRWRPGQHTNLINGYSKHVNRKQNRT